MRRYDGNSGRYINVPDEDSPQRQNISQPPRQQPAEVPEAEKTSEHRQNQKAMPPPKQFGSGLQNILSNIFAQGFEVEDLLLFAVLFLMYQETKDKELLIIMGGMFLL